jgi:hypothetical protein
LHVKNGKENICTQNLPDSLAGGEGESKDVVMAIAMARTERNKKDLFIEHPLRYHYLSDIDNSEHENLHYTLYLPSRRPKKMVLPISMNSKV